MDSNRPTHYTYQLPDGTRFQCAADLCKGASVITFELKAVPPALRGRIVDAIIVTAPRPRDGRCLCGLLVADHFTRANRKLTCEETARRAELPTVRG